jgi:hypothetical protein
MKCAKRAWFLFFTGLAVGLASATEARAYTATLAAGSQLVRWPGDGRLELAGNPVNSSGLSEREVADAVIRGLQRWEKAGGGRLGFDYWQGTSADYEVNGSFNGQSSFYFASRAPRDPNLSANVLGLTQVWYDTRSGAILETDIVLNDRDFTFSTDPRDTSGSAVGGRGRVYIENVLTHELGHAFGLSHSGTMQASMLFMESPEQAHLGCDELVGVRALYPAADRTARGAITGGVADGSGRAIFGAHVLAISRDRGTVLASALTDLAGRYRIEALEPGAYYLMVEPFFAGAAALPGYYAGISAGVCANGDDFARSFLTEPGLSALRVVTVGAGGATEAPPFAALCASDSAAAVGAQVGTSDPATAPVVLEGGAAGFGTTDSFARSNVGYYRLNGVRGRLELHALGFSLYSRARASVALFRANGTPVAATVADPVYEGDSGYVNHDSALVAEALPAGDYVARVTVAGVPTADYPAGQIMMDSARFVALTGSVDAAAAPLASALPVNARCRMDESFVAYSARTGVPPRRSLAEEEGKTGFCGSIRQSRGTGGSDGGSGPGPGAILGWFAPWAFMLAAVRLARARATAHLRLP